MPWVVRVGVFVGVGWGWGEVCIMMVHLRVGINC